MKINFKFIIFSVFTFIIFFSCKKTDFKSSSNIETTNNIEEKFFNNYRSTDPSEKKLVDFIKKQNDKLHFVEKTANQIGYPRWNKAVVIKKASTSFTNSSDSSTNIYYIPFVRDSQNYVNASIQITTTANDSSFTYLQDWQYKNLQNNINSYTDSAESLAIFFMFLDKNVFGNNVFNILDSNLFRVNNQKPTFVRLDSVAATSFNFLYPIVTCIPGTILFPCSVLGGNINGQNSPTSNTAACSVSWNYCFISGIYNDDPTGNTTTGGGGGGTSNGGPSSGPTGGGSGGSGVGWTPVPLNPTVIYIQNALGLDGFEPSWLATHSQRATEIKNYLVQNNNSLASKIIATQHLVRMMIDTEYLAFVPTHLQTGNTTMMWWEDDAWDNDDPITQAGISYIEPQIGPGGITQKTLDHVLKGEIKSGKGQGCHSINAINSGLARWRPNTTQTAGPGGCQRGYIDIKMPNGAWAPKAAQTTFFPSSWSDAKITQELNLAYSNKYKVVYNPALPTSPAFTHWEGIASNGMKIMFILSNIDDPGSEVVTAYPIY